MFKDDEAKGLFEMGLDALQTVHGCRGWVPTLKKLLRVWSLYRPSIHGCSSCPNFQELLSFILAKKREENRNTDHPWLQRLSQLSRTLSFILAKEKKEKGEYGHGITYIQNCELKLLGTKAHANQDTPIIISHIVWERGLWCLTRAAVSVAKWSCYFVKGDCFPFFLSLPLLWKLWCRVVCHSYSLVVRTSKQIFFPFNFLINININIFKL